MVHGSPYETTRVQYLGLPHELAFCIIPEWVSYCCAALINEAYVSVCCATLLSNELVGSTCGQAQSCDPREAGHVGLMGREWGGAILSYVVPELFIIPA